MRPGTFARIAQAAAIGTALPVLLLAYLSGLWTPEFPVYRERIPVPGATADLPDRAA